MLIRRLELTNFRNYEQVSFVFEAGTTAIVGNNGHGKTNVAEAMGWLATLASFRGAPTEAMVRVGCETAVVRAEVVHDDGRELLIESEINRQGRNRVMVNKQRLAKTRDLLGALRVTVFSPDDLELVKGGPGERRRYLDDSLVSLHAKYHQVLSDLDRVLRQRNVLLKQAGGRLHGDVGLTLDVWDARLVQCGEALGDARAALVGDLAPLVEQAYADLTGVVTPITMRYDPPWRQTGLAAALAQGRHDDVRRQISLVGPHRDDVELSLNALPSRTHSSQGEQRTLALALRFAIHRLVSDRAGSPPVLILDDVLSELDPTRAQALLDHLPRGQVVLTTAGTLPPAARPEAIVRIVAGTVVA